MKFRFPYDRDISVLFGSGHLRSRAMEDTPVQCSAPAEGRYGLLTTRYALRTQSVATLPFPPTPPVQGVGRVFSQLVTLSY
jgi:hypothetical protein